MTPLTLLDLDKALRASWAEYLLLRERVSAHLGCFPVRPGYSLDHPLPPDLY